MPRIGVMELLIILLVALLFINPKDLPKLFRSIGRLYRRMRDMSDTLRRTVSSFEEEPKPRAARGGQKQTGARSSKGQESEEGAET